MRNDFVCPICTHNNWEELGGQVFQKPTKDINTSTRLRLEILLEDLNDNISSLDIIWIMCRHCSFICYRPRPTAEEINTKYQRIAQKRHNKRLPDIEYLPAKEYTVTDWKKSNKYEINTERAMELYLLLKPWLQKGFKILDFGGARGAVLEYFVKQNYECHIIDYGCRSPLSGVTYAGPTIDNTQDKYDIAIINHVFEHVVNPKQDLLKVKEKLKEGGIIYIEVPFELWKKNCPKPSEPLTHINKFSVQSIDYLIRIAGLKLIGCYYGGFRTNTGKKSLAVKALCEKPVHDLRNEKLNAKDLEKIKSLQKGDIKALLEGFMPESFMT